MKTGYNATSIAAYITLRYTKTTDIPESPVKLVGQRGEDGKSTYRIALDNYVIPQDMTEEEFVTWSKGDKGQDGTVTFDELTPNQMNMLKGDNGPQGIGLNIEKTFLTLQEMNESLETETYRDGTVVFKEEVNYSRIINNADVYISPEGDDLTGDGTIDNPWKTLKKVPEFSLVGLLPGIYSDVSILFNPNTYGTTKLDQLKIYMVFGMVDIHNQHQMLTHKKQKIFLLILTHYGE